ncbi:hypothetical protein V6N11_008187 [Hibiscus sabdariffa]|uniref:Uncharacterized protein n=1 Tax=Hibiscus sabdariffa TaxID=183260 RepID=A0ABR2Q0F1_9ROSI
MPVIFKLGHCTAIIRLWCDVVEPDTRALPTERREMRRDGGVNCEEWACKVVAEGMNEFGARMERSNGGACKGGRTIR